MVQAKLKSRKHMARNSLIAWWLGLGAFIALPWVQSLLQELRSFKPSSAARKKKRKEKNNEKKKNVVGGGFRMGNTCTPMADSCEGIAKNTTIL